LKDKELIYRAWKLVNFVGPVTWLLLQIWHYDYGKLKHQNLPQLYHDGTVNEKNKKTMGSRANTIRASGSLTMHRQHFWKECLKLCRLFALGLCLTIFHPFPSGAVENLYADIWTSINYWFEYGFIFLK